MPCRKIPIAGRNGASAGTALAILGAAALRSFRASAASAKNVVSTPICSLPAAESGRKLCLPDDERENLRQALPILKKWFEPPTGPTS
jgi:hypothetical protein